jgi:hypothetical protein
MMRICSDEYNAKQAASTKARRPAKKAKDALKREQNAAINAHTLPI